MDTAISIDPDTGRPWRPRFDAKTLLVEERMLQAACYIVCAYLTGMRDCEVQAMRAAASTSRAARTASSSATGSRAPSTSAAIVRGQSESMDHDRARGQGHHRIWSA